MARAQSEHTLQQREILARKEGACAALLARPAREEAGSASLLVKLETFILSVACHGSARRASPVCEWRRRRHSGAPVG